jgi:hypothetical protein
MKQNKQAWKPIIVEPVLMTQPPTIAAITSDFSISTVNEVRGSSNLHGGENATVQSKRNLMSTERTIVKQTTPYSKSAGIQSNDENRHHNKWDGNSYYEVNTNANIRNG